MAGACSLGQNGKSMLSGFSPIVTTASLHNADHLQSLEATHVLVRRLTKDVRKERIAQICDGTPLLYAFGTISVEETQRAAYESLAPGGKLTEVFQHFSPRHDPESGKKALQAWACRRQSQCCGSAPRWTEWCEGRAREARAWRGKRLQAQHSTARNRVLRTRLFRSFTNFQHSIDVLFSLSTVLFVKIEIKM
ncbi:hypothetical protein JVU11DRAFT_11355 [Chiua virens]|nr:hypothetical protein JVU11DRAFT_11355 [Chiua virens]